jgi:hypothetical protein
MAEQEWYEWSWSEEEELNAEACENARETQVEKIREIIREHQCECWDQLGPVMMGRMILVSEVVNELGDSSLYVLASPGLTPWEATGLLDWAKP